MLFLAIGEDNFFTKKNLEWGVTVLLGRGITFARKGASAHTFTPTILRITKRC